MTEAACWFCGGQLIWNNDHSFEEVGYDGDGVVSIHTCKDCDATAEFTKKE